MSDIKEMYRTGLHAQIEVLETARDQLSSDPGEAAQVVRRAAHALRSSAPTYGFDRLAREAEALDEAGDDLLAQRLDSLLEALREATQGPAEAARHRARILVVSSSPRLGELLQGLRPKAEIVLAGNAAEARKALTLEQVSGVVLDLVLPEQDGRRLLAELRRERATAHLPVVVIVPGSSPRIENECRDLEVSHVFVEPVETAALADAIIPLVEIDQQTSDRQEPLAGPADLQSVFKKVRARAALVEHPMSLAVFEVDGAEDEIGHPVHRSILEQVAYRIGRALRKSDLLARWTGGELVALLVDTTLEGARRALEKAREAVAEAPIEGPQGPLSLTLSGGLAQLLEVETLGHAVAEADRFALQARLEGGNRVIDGTSGIETERPSVLVIEEDELLVFLSKQRLGRAGFSVSHARTAAEARDRAVPDLWVVDSRLPDAKLEELIPELRQRGEGTPLLAVVPAGDRELVAKALAIGVDDFIVRPFEPLELQIRAQRLLKRPKEPATVR